jgi:hypothetical protein
MLTAAETGIALPSKKHGKQLDYAEMKLLKLPFPSMTVLAVPKSDSITLRRVSIATLDLLPGCSVSTTTTIPQ